MNFEMNYTNISEIVGGKMPSPKSDTPESNDFDVPSFVIHVILTSLIFVFGVTGNSVLLLILTKRRMRTLKNCFVLNLAFTNMIVLFFHIPLSFISEYTSWPFGEFGCVYIFSFFECLIGVGTLTHASLSLFLYLSLQHVRFQKIHIFLCLALIWVISYMTLSFPFLGFVSKLKHNLETEKCEMRFLSSHLKRVYTFLSLTITFLYPLTITGISYLLVYRIITISHRNISSHLTERDSKRRNVENRRRNLAFVAMFIMFAISTLPWQTFHLVDISGGIPENFGRTNIGYNVGLILLDVFYSQVIWDPYVLIFMSAEYRRQFKKMKIGGACCDGVYFRRVSGFFSGRFSSSSQNRPSTISAETEVNSLIEVTNRGSREQKTITTTL